MSNIIEKILKSKGNDGKLTAKDFFTENNPHGYSDKPSFNNHITTIGEKDLKHLELFSEYTTEGYKINSLPIVNLDKEGKKYIYPQFTLPNSVQPFKVLVFSNLIGFVKDYQQGKIQPSFTLEELYNEASTESPDKE